MNVVALGIAIYVQCVIKFLTSITLYQFPLKHHLLSLRIVDICFKYSEDRFAQNSHLVKVIKQEWNIVEKKEFRAQ